MSLIFIGLDLVVTRKKECRQNHCAHTFQIQPLFQVLWPPSQSSLGPEVGVSILFCTGLLQVRLAMTLGFWNSLQEGLWSSCWWVSLPLCGWPAEVTLTHFLTHFNSLFCPSLVWSFMLHPNSLWIHMLWIWFFFLITPKINTVQLHARISLTDLGWIVHCCIVSSALSVPYLLVPLCMNSSAPCPVYFSASLLSYHICISPFYGIVLELCTFFRINTYCNYGFAVLKVGQIICSHLV